MSGALKGGAKNDVDRQLLHYRATLATIRADLAALSDIGTQADLEFPRLFDRIEVEIEERTKARSGSPATGIVLPSVLNAKTLRILRALLDHHPTIAIELCKRELQNLKEESKGVCSTLAKEISKAIELASKDDAWITCMTYLERRS